MKLTRWQRPELTWTPFRQLSTLRDEIDRLFDAPLSSLTELSQPFSSGWVPALDLSEDKDNYVVQMELPGMNKEAIDISLHEGVLSISGERKEEEKHEAHEAYRSERFFGRFQRSVTLPAAVDAEKVSAAYKDGILTVTLPKTEEAKPKQITINAK
jgi:HSP20 family protein